MRPELRDRSAEDRAVVVARHQSIEGLRRALLEPGVVWKRPPKEARQIQIVELIERVCSQLKPGRLLLIFDQFEELLVVLDRKPEQFQDVEAVLKLLVQGTVSNVVGLVVLRSDYMEMLHDLQDRLGFPPTRRNDNWKSIGPFNEDAARKFLVGSKLSIGPKLMDEVIRQIAEIEEADGLIRPITLNLVGLILARTAIDGKPVVPRYREAGGLIYSYLRQCLRRSNVRDHAPGILRRLISPSGSKQPRFVAELAEKTKFQTNTILGCLLHLSDDGLVRQIDEKTNLWEISHEFVARLLVSVLGAWRVGRFHVLRPWATPIALAIWSIVFLLMPSVAPWYKRVPQIALRRPDEIGNFWMHKAAQHEFEDEGMAACDYFLARGAEVDPEDALGRTPLSFAAEKGHVKVLELLVAKHARLDARDKKGMTPLHWATINSRTQAAKALIDHGATVAFRDLSKKTAMHFASIAGSVELLQLLISRGIDIQTASDQGHTPLHLAVMNGNADATRLLIASGAYNKVLDEKGNLPLHLAILSGSLETVEVLLNSDDLIDFYAENADQLTPLQLAARGTNVAIVETLLNAGADLTARDKNGRSLLYHAVWGGHLETVRMLLKRGADPKLTDNTGDTALHIAAEKGHLPVVAILLSHGVLPDAKNGKGKTPLFAAAAFGRLDVVALLLENKVRCDDRDQDGWTSMHFAAYSGEIAMLNLLHSCGAPTDETTVKGVTPLYILATTNKRTLEAGRLLVTWGADLNKRKEGGFSLLEMAAVRRRTDMARFLLDLGARVDDRNAGRTPLHTASSTGADDFVKLLLEYHADPNATADGGITPLHIAARHGSAKIAELLLDHGAAVDQRDMHGLTALHHWGIRDGKPETALMLIKRNADSNALDSDGRTPLMGCVIADKADAAKLMLNHQANINARDKRGNTALHWAVKLLHIQPLRLLLEKHAKTEERDSDGGTPLHLAANSGWVEGVQTLLDHEVLVDATDNSGLTPLHLAAAAGHTMAASLLLKHGANIDAIAKEGSTPLFHAVFCGKEETARMLLRENASATRRFGAEGNPLLHVAAYKGNIKMTELLLAHGASVAAKDARGRSALQLAEFAGSKDVAKLLRNAESSFYDHIFPSNPFAR